MQNNIVKVTLHGKEVGRLYWDARLRRAIFSFAPSFVAEGKDIAPLTASIKDGKRASSPILGNKEKLFQGLPSFIADSLPDRWGNQVFEQWAAQNKIPMRNLTPVDKLAFIGKRGMGALEFEPATEGFENSDNIQLGSLYHLAKKIFEQREVATILPDEELSLQSLYEVGTSAGGQHPKAIIAINDKTGDIRSGQILLPEDYTYYILKFAEGEDFPFTNVEMVYYELAKLAHIEMMPSQLLQIEGEYHFLTERYDRKKGKKVHTQTLAAMCPDATSYEDLFSVARMLAIPGKEMEELYRRMVFSVFGANVDDHIKNFSFLLDDEGLWHITPAYDLTFTVNLDGTGYENRHSMTLLGKDEELTEEDLLLFAKENNIRDARRIIGEVAQAFTHFYDIAIANHIEDYWASRIEKYLSQGIPSEYADEMKHYLPTFIEPYRDEDNHNLEVQSFKLSETKRHDFHLQAMINGKGYRYVVGRRNPVAQEIIDAGRAKMPVDTIKSLIKRYLIPLAARD